MLQHPHFDPLTILDICRNPTLCEVDRYLQEPDARTRDFIRTCARLQTGHTLETELRSKRQHRRHEPHIKPPAWTLPPTLRHNTWALAVWIRINVADALARVGAARKEQRFVAAHLRAMRYLEHTGVVVDETYLETLYEPLGPSYYDEDRNAIRLDTQRYPCAPAPLSIIETAFPTVGWRLEQSIDELSDAHIAQIRQHGYDIAPCQPWQAHRIYYGSLLIMLRCQLHYEEAPATCQDALWQYHACFLDLLQHCAGWTDERMRSPVDKTHILTPLEMYFPTDNRAFTSNDLPDVFHTLATIPLWGEQHTPPFALGKLLQKCLPLCYVRRTLITKSDEYMRSDAGFWNLFSAVFECLLLDMYPSTGSRHWDLKYLLFCKRLVNNPAALRQSLSRSHLRPAVDLDSFNEETDKSCYVITTAFRMWIIAMLREQEPYVRVARQHFDWDAFCSETHNMAATIRRHMVMGDDPFVEARTLLKRTKQIKVHRYRKLNVISTLREHMTGYLEKTLYAKAESIVPLDNTIKANIMNIVLRVPRNQWFSLDMLSLLRLPQYGGIADASIPIVYQLMGIYYGRNKPKDYRACIKALVSISPLDFQSILWTINLLHHMQGIDFVPLTLSQVRNVEKALLGKRYHLHPAQPLNPNAYDICVTLCCSTLKTLIGSNRFGHDGCAYDMDRAIYVCSKSHKKMSDDLSTYLEDVPVNKRMRDERKHFTHIPCKDNPVLLMSLRGFACIYNGQRYMHCPSCGELHVHCWSGWSGSEGGQYRCPQCVERAYHYTCTVCGLPVSDKFTLQVMDPMAPGGTADIFQRLYFCRPHFVFGSRIHMDVPKDALMRIIVQRAQRKRK